MRDLWLHAGLHKTGTSSLQKLMIDNRDLLAEAGTGMGPHQNPDSGGHHAILEAIDRDGAEAVFDAVSALPGDRLIISAEDFCLRLENPEFARAVHEAAARHFRPRILLWLRRQDYLRESIHAEAAKFYQVGDVTRPTDQERYLYDHDARLRALEAVFGRENITIRIYRDDRPNDIIGSFWSIVDPDFDPARLRPEARRNVSLSRRRVLLQTQLPWKTNPDGEPRNLGLCRHLNLVLNRTRAIADDGIRCLASPEERQDFVAPFLEGNRAVAERYGIADPGSFVDLPTQDPDWTPAAPITQGEALGVLRESLSAAWRRFSPIGAARISLELIRVFAAWRLRGTAGQADGT